MVKHGSKSIKLFIILVLLFVSLCLLGAKPKPAMCFGCGGFCQWITDCSVGCTCVGATIGNQGICRSPFQIKD